MFNNLLIKLFSSQLIRKFWSKLYKAEKNFNSPWTELSKPIKKCKIVLISTGGIILKKDQPFDLDNPEGDYSFRRIPYDVNINDLTISHKYYDHTDASMDPNLIFPIEVLNELQKDGLVGPSNCFHYSFMGHIKKSLLSYLKESAIKVSDELNFQKVDIALLVPA